ncbi:MAG: glycosyltransferase family 61 protein [Silvania sp.]
MIKLNFNKSLTSQSLMDNDLNEISSDITFRVSTSNLLKIEDVMDGKSFVLHQEPSLEAVPAPLTMLSPLEWTKHNEWQKINGINEEDITLSVLHKPHVFGGRIRRRNSKFHEFSQLLTNSKYELLKNSYGILDGSKTLPGDLVKEIDGSFYLDCESLGIPTFLEGDYFFIGSIHRHFGHFLVEGLSRLWALDFIPNNIKDNMNFLIYEDSIPNFAIQTLEILGISSDKIVYAPKHAIVERLFVPDVSYKTHHWASNLMQSTYNNISREISPNAQSERRIYLSRKHTSDRPLDNEDRIEKIFSSFNFEIIHPEKLTIKEQIKIISESKFIAGPVGSQMYLSAFSKSKTIIIFAPNNFYLPDDLLLASIRGSETLVCLGSGIDYTKTKEERKWTITESRVINLLENLNYD